MSPLPDLIVLVTFIAIVLFGTPKPHSEQGRPHSEQGHTTSPH